MIDASQAALDSITDMQVLQGAACGLQVAAEIESFRGSYLTTSPHFDECDHKLLYSGTAFEIAEKF